MKFMTEPPSSATAASAPASLEIGDGEVAPAEKPHTPPMAAEKAAPAPSSGKAAASEAEGGEDLSAGILFDDGDVDAGGTEAGDEREFGGTAKEPSDGKAFSRDQMTEMVRNHAFSSGFQKYGQYMKKSTSSAESGQTVRRKSDGLAQLDGERSTFFKREASDFGVSFITRKETDHWAGSTRGMGARSSSEGALLKFAYAAVQDATRTVADELGVDVSKTDMWQLRRPSFLARLDLRPEVEAEFLRDPTSSTAQATAKMYGGDQGKNRRMTSIGGIKKGGDKKKSIKQGGGGGKSAAKK